MLAGAVWQEEKGFPFSRTIQTHDLGTVEVVWLRQERTKYDPQRWTTRRTHYEVRLSDRTIAFQTVTAGDGMTPGEALSHALWVERQLAAPSCVCGIDHQFDRATLGRVTHGNQAASA